MSEGNMIINSIAPNMSTLYRHLDGGYCNRDFPIPLAPLASWGFWLHGGYCNRDFPIAYDSAE